MDNSIFREKSLKSISSPDDLNEYVKVANPGVWALLIGIIFLLLGFIAWGVFGKIDTKVTSFAVVDNERGITYISEDKLSDINDSSYIIYDDVKCEILDVSDFPVQLGNSVDSSFLHIAGFDNDNWVYPIEFSISDISNGVYHVEIVTESVKPISLLFD